MTVNEKLDKERKKLENLVKQKAELDQKINKVKSNINEYTKIIEQAKFDELADVITAKGLSLEQVIDAVQSGTLSNLLGNTDTESNEANGQKGI